MGCFGHMVLHILNISLDSSLRIAKTFLHGAMHMVHSLLCTQEYTMPTEHLPMINLFQVLRQVATYADAEIVILQFLAHTWNKPLAWLRSIGKQYLPLV